MLHRRAGAAPDRWQTWCKRAEVYKMIRVRENAVADLSKAIALNPGDGELWLERAMARPMTSNVDEAIHDATMAISLDPKVSAYCLRGDLFRISQQWNRAIADYDRVLSIRNTDEYVWYYRGECQAALERWDLAARDLGESLRLKPMYRRMLAHLRRTPDRDIVWLSLACYRAAAADATGHRKACADFLFHYGQTTKPMEACRLALSFFLDPQRVGPDDAPAKLAAFASANAPQDLWCTVARAPPFTAWASTRRPWSASNNSKKV